MALKEWRKLSGTLASFSTAKFLKAKMRSTGATAWGHLSLHFRQVAHVQSMPEVISSSMKPSLAKLTIS